MRSLRCLALHMGRDHRFLDHIIPLSWAFEMPVLITEESNVALANKYYPMVETLYEDYTNLSYEKLAENFEILFQSTFWNVNLVKYFAELSNKKMRFVYSPHGNSDKGYVEPALEKIVDQDIVLLYGDHMVDRLKKQKYWDSIPHYLITGNYRLDFYQKHRDFYDTFLEKEVFSHLDSKNQNILYAPTWNDFESCTSFYDQVEKLAQTIPKNYNLIIKPHPLLEEREPARFWATMPSVSSSNLLILDHFPLIYPLLQKTDIYLGDFSSIGYDFLFFQKPMFFFNSLQGSKESDPSLYLHRCGLTVPNECSNIFSWIDEHLEEAKNFQEIQSKTYHYAFGKTKDSLKLREEMEKVFHSS